MDRVEKSVPIALPRPAPPQSARRESERDARRRDFLAKETRSDRAILASLRDHIAAHLDEDLTLAVLARRAGMSASCFSRWFRDRTGKTPHAFVLEARVSRAKALLRRSDLPLLEVALAVGFTSQSCLNVTFRRRVGMTPAEYRAGFSKKAKDARARSARSSRTTEPAPRARRATSGSAAGPKGAIS